MITSRVNARNRDAKRPAYEKKAITITKALLIFTGFTAYFFLLLYTLLPFLKSHFSLNPALYWFVTGYFLFIPLFIFAIAMVRNEGNKEITQIMHALHIRLFSGSDWRYALGGLLVLFIATGCIFGISAMLTRYLGMKGLSTTPWFMEMRPLAGDERLLLLIWLPMFFFNIAGEELLWRGYIQARLRGPYSWLFCSLLWLVFHIPFGIDLMIMLIPVIIIIPYVFHKTRNSLTGIFIHGIYNGPIFILVALGMIK